MRTWAAAMSGLPSITYIPASDANETIIASPQRMMSRIVTTSSADTRSTAARPTNNTSSQRIPVSGIESPIGMPRLPPPKVPACRDSGPEKRPTLMRSLSVCLAAAGGTGERRWQSRQEFLRRSLESSFGEGVGHPVALASDVGYFGLAVDRGQADQIDLGVAAVGVGELVVLTVAEGIVWTGVHADAAQDAATLVDVVFLKNPRLGHERAGWACFGAAAAGDAGRVVEAHVERRRHQSVEAGPHEVVAGRADDFGTDDRTTSAVDAARRLAQDEGVAVIADVVVVGAGEAVLGDAAEAGPLVVARLQRLESCSVLDTEAAQVAVADRLAGALQAARGFGHDLGRGVRDLVLDVGLGPLLGRERLEAVARFLGLVGVGHDREEDWLHFGQRLAVPQLREVVASEERVHGVGAAAPLGDGLNHGRGPDPDVAGTEDAGPARLEGYGVGAQLVLDRGHALVARADPRQIRPLADGQQDAVALDHELRPGGGLGAAPAAGVGGAGLHPDELDARDLVVRVDDDTRWAGLEDGLAAFLESLVDLARGRHVLHVAAVDEGDRLGALADRGPPAVHGREAAADDNHAALLVARVGQAEGGDLQVLEAVDDPVGRVVGDVDLVGFVAAGGDNGGVEAVGLEVVQVEVLAQRLVADQAAAELPDGLVFGVEDLGLGQAVLRNAIAEHSAGLRVALEDGHVVAGEEKVVGRGHAGRPGADHGHTFAGLGRGLERQRRLDPFLLRRQDLVAGIAVAVSNGDGLVHFVASAVVLARSGTDAAEDRREGDGPLEDAGGLPELALRVRLEKARNIDVAGALVLAGRQAVGVVVAEDKLEVGSPQPPDLLGLSADHHFRLGRARARDRRMLFALNFHDAHPAGAEARQLWLIAESRNLDAVGPADFEDRLAFVTLNDAAVHLKLERGCRKRALRCLGCDQVFRVRVVERRDRVEGRLGIGPVIDATGAVVRRRALVRCGTEQMAQIDHALVVVLEARQLQRCSRRGHRIGGRCLFGTGSHLGVTKGRGGGAGALG